MNAFIEAWGGGNGRIRHLMPSTRLVCGFFAFASCSVAPLDSLCGAELLFVILLGWVAWCGIPLRRLAAVFFFSSCLFLPLLLLTLVTHTQAVSDSWSKVLHIPMAIGLRGTACVMVCAATLSVLDISELGQGLSGLPLPRTLTALLLQIAHQTALLSEESHRMVAALRVRGVPSATVSVRLRCLFMMPVLWLLRLLMRVDRVSAAMEVRGFDGLLRSGRVTGASAGDYGAVAVSLLLFGTVLLMRCLEAR